MEYPAHAPMDIDSLDIPACCKGKLRKMSAIEDFGAALDRFLLASPSVNRMGHPRPIDSPAAKAQRIAPWEAATAKIPTTYLARLAWMAKTHVDRHAGCHRVQAFWRDLSERLDQVVQRRTKPPSPDDIVKGLGSKE